MPAKIVRHRSGKGWIQIGRPTAAQALENCLKYNHVVSVTSVNHRSDDRSRPQETDSEDQGPKEQR